MGYGNLSIGRVDGVRAIRPGLGEQSAVGKVGQNGQRAGWSRNDRADKADKAQNSGETRGAERTRYRSKSSEEGSLTLTTAEGDKVTISFRNQQSTKVDQAKLYGPDGSYERTRVKTRESSELSVSLEGNLSEEELADIKQLVEKLSSGITAARSGDAEGAQSALAPSEGLDTIAGYNFSYQQQSDVSFRASRLSVTA